MSETAPHPMPRYTLCKTCKGHGIVYAGDFTEEEGQAAGLRPCVECRGYHRFEVCPACNGKRGQREVDQQEVEVPEVLTEVG